MKRKRQNDLDRLQEIIKEITLSDYPVIGNHHFIIDCDKCGKPVSRVESLSPGLYSWYCDECGISEIFDATDDEDPGEEEEWWLE